MKPKFTERFTRGIAIGAAALALGGCKSKETERDKAVKEADQLMAQETDTVNQIRLEQLKKCLQGINPNYFPVYQVGYHALKDNKDPNDSNVTIRDDKKELEIAINLKSCSISSNGPSNKGKYKCTDSNADGEWEYVSPIGCSRTINPFTQPFIDTSSKEDSPGNWIWSQTMCHERLKFVFEFIKKRGTTYLDPSRDETSL